GEWSEWWGNLGGRPWDEMQTGDMHLLWRFAQKPQGEFCAGAGFCWLSDKLGTNYGVSAPFGLESPPRQPLGFSLQVEGGALRHDPFFHGRITAGCLWKRCEVFAGFDYMQIDRLEAAGPVAGLRLWL